MMETIDLRLQHDVIGQLAVELIDHVSRRQCDFDAARVTHLLAKLNGLLRVHFAQEDCLLYPAMIAGDNLEAAQLAWHYQLEMGGLAEQFEAYMRRWSVSAAITAAYEDFCHDTRTILAALDARIDRENEILYPAADSLFAARAAA